MLYQRMFIFLLMVFFFGCATAPKKQPATLQELQNRVVFLEEELQRKDGEIKDLENQLKPQPTVMFFNSDSSMDASSGSLGKQEAIFPPTELQTQKALKNAGFYQGSIDGKIGPKTLQAIKDFQESQGLSPDGKVGIKTWSVLKLFLN